VNETRLSKSWRETSINFISLGFSALPALSSREPSLERTITRGTTLGTTTSAVSPSTKLPIPQASKCPKSRVNSNSLHLEFFYSYYLSCGYVQVLMFAALGVLQGTHCRLSRLSTTELSTRGCFCLKITRIISHASLSLGIIRCYKLNCGCMNLTWNSTRRLTRNLLRSCYH
jgi:hypothetical protein